MKIHDERTDYLLNESINPSDLLESPFEQFKIWYQTALTKVNKDPNAMLLSTYDGKTPRGRIVLLKELDDKGFVFFSNYESDKAKELEANPNASLTFFWSLLERQVRVEGKIERTSAEDSDAYFLSRPLGSRLGAWASPQSKKIESKEWLKKEVENYKKKFNVQDIQRPENWGGFRLIPTYFEYWQGASSRLHDRISYELENGIWVKNRLAP